MRRILALLGLPLLVVVAGCAPAGSDPSTAGGAEPSVPDQRRAAFDKRAAEVAGAWRPGPGWDTGYVPLQEPTVLTGDPRFSPDTETAFRAGWYRLQNPLPMFKLAPGTIRFPDGTMTVPLVGADEAFRQLDQGDPPPCEGRPMTPPGQSPAPGSDPTAPAGRPRAPGPGPTIEPGPDTPVQSEPSTACVPLTVTGVRLGIASVRTSRGVAEVPAWLFTVEELAVPVARVAVAPDAVTAPPEGSGPGTAAPPDVVAGVSLRAVTDGRIDYRVGVGACDSDITPLVVERDDVVVVGAAVVRPTGPCTMQLKLEPVSVSLTAPLGDRPVLDVVTGAPLALTRA
ncbi:hypothetical protein [Micromonospora siamensis]|uniref:Uncharacterized protein n=1 Tax=Micromonospora siamensis TaxID=299152 RepID=A0A1C5HGB6_9ACTN|nr:hypothetical protein [Micromonospora siamensis]SCG45052.1 hypothetical protein GA0074704_1680 [Micromonospora siamensis]